MQNQMIVTVKQKQRNEM